jgi:hypothetical protein
LKVSDESIQKLLKKEKKTNIKKPKFLYGPIQGFHLDLEFCGGLLLSLKKLKSKRGIKLVEKFVSTTSIRTTQPILFPF